MSRHGKLHGISMVATVALAAVGTMRAAETAQQPSSPGTRPPGAIERVYRVQNLDALEAVGIAHQVCRSMVVEEEQCAFRIQGNRWFTYTAPAAVHEKIAVLLKERDAAPSTLNFRIVLLLGDSAERPLPALPESERRALADLQKVFPYRGYTVIDSGAIRSKEEARLTLGGSEGYTAYLRFTRDETGSGPSVAFKKFVLTRRSSEGSGAAASSDDGKQQPNVNLLETSFSLEVGETVVVGTSRLDGNDRALIVLLTATR